MYTNWKVCTMYLLCSHRLGVEISHTEGVVTLL